MSLDRLKELTGLHLNEKYGDAYYGGDISEEDDGTMVEVVDAKGEEYGHFTVYFYTDGKIEVHANPGKPTETQKKQIIAVAKKHMEDKS